MKAVIKIFILFIALTSGTWIAPQKASAQVSVSFQVFYDDLSPYGYWVDNPEYGYVWVPNVSGGFTPYGTNGYWILTDAGWTWVSNYPWGWAPFHYGRWYADPNYGYLWIPGNEWGPGWVTWRQSEGYYGWAPIGPGISIDVAYSNGYSVPYNQWTFVRDRDFGRTNINNYYVAPSNNTTIINNSTVINNIQVDKSSSVKYNAGPDRTQVQRQTGTTVAPVALRESAKPGENLSNGELQIYRPRVEKGKAVPNKVANLKDVKPASQRNAETQPLKENQPANQQPAHQQQSQPNKAQPSQPQPDAQPVKQQPLPQQHNRQPSKAQPSQPQPDAQPAKQQPLQQQHRSQPNKVQPSQPQPDAQPAKQQPSQQQHRNQPNKAQPSQPQPEGQPLKQQSPHQQRSDQPAKPQPSQPQQPQQPRHDQSNPPQPKLGGENQPQPKHPGKDNHQPSQQRQPEPPQNKEEENKPH